MGLFVQSEEVILLGDFEFVCYTLNNGLRVFSHTRILNILMADYTNRNLHKHLDALIPFLPFIFIQRKIRLSVVFKHRDRNIRGIGYDDFKTLCAAFLNANEQGKLPSKFLFMVMISELFQLHDEKRRRCDDMRKTFSNKDE